MALINDIAITSIDQITAFDIETGALRFILDELQDASIAQTFDTTEITGRAGRTIMSFQKNKKLTVSGTNGLFSTGLFELQAGSELADAAETTISWTDYLTVENDSATTTYKAIGETGSEIKALYVKRADGVVLKQFEQAAAAAAGEFAYAPNSKALTFSSDEIEDGTEIVVIYDRTINANLMESDSMSVAKKAKLYIDAQGEDTCNHVFHIQFYIPVAEFSGEFTLDMGGDQTVHDFEATSIVTGSCGQAGGNWTYTIFADDEADAT